MAHAPRKFKEFVDMAILTQIWAGKKPSTLDIFIAYDLASFEGLHVFSIDALNDIMATEAGVIFGEAVQAAPLTTSQMTEQKMSQAFLTARDRFRQHRLLTPRPSIRRSLYSLLTSTAEDGAFLPTIIEKHWAAKPQWNDSRATIWKSTIGSFCEKNNALFDTDKNRDKFLKDLEDHLAATESTDWATLVPSASHILSTAEDVGMLNQAIEVLVLLSE